MQLPLLLSLLAIPALSLKTEFFFNGTITCSKYSPFSYQIQVIEKDNLSPDDELSRMSFVTSEVSPVNYSIYAVDTDDGPFDHYYEIVYLVYHDCGPKHMHLYKEFHIGYFYVHHGKHYHTFDLDITDKGNKSYW